ncbi:hypothetical protein K438DRAFT_2004242 [Mycena galopus ATCC 62051]|nr:hypothetical protein K438DRAFT_2004242 [Mycena galopus ATCC 62051]
MEERNRCGRFLQGQGSRSKAPQTSAASGHVSDPANRVSCLHPSRFDQATFAQNFIIIIVWRKDKSENGSFEKGASQKAVLGTEAIGTGRQTQSGGEAEACLSRLAIVGPEEEEDQDVAVYRLCLARVLHVTLVVAQTLEPNRIASSCHGHDYPPKSHTFESSLSSCSNTVTPTSRKPTCAVRKVVSLTSPVASPSTRNHRNPGYPAQTGLRARASDRVSAPTQPRHPPLFYQNGLRACASGPVSGLAQPPQIHPCCFQTGLRTRADHASVVAQTPQDRPPMSIPSLSPPVLREPKLVRESRCMSVEVQDLSTGHVFFVGVRPACVSKTTAFSSVHLDAKVAE